MAATLNLLYSQILAIVLSRLQNHTHTLNYIVISGDFSMTSEFKVESPIIDDVSPMYNNTDTDIDTNNSTTCEWPKITMVYNRIIRDNKPVFLESIRINYLSSTQ